MQSKSSFLCGLGKVLQYSAALKGFFSILKIFIYTFIARLMLHAPAPNSFSDGAKDDTRCMSAPTLTRILFLFTEVGLTQKF